MREILFKAKRLDNGEWVYGDLIKNSIIDCFTYISKGVGYKVDDEEIGKPIKVFPLTVGQFTGLTDKNGKKIFEGDRVQYYSSIHGEFRGDLCEVKYGEFNCSCCEGVYGWYFENGDIRDSQTYEVIGTIHDKAVNI